MNNKKSIFYILGVLLYVIEINPNKETVPAYIISLKTSLFAMLFSFFAMLNARTPSPMAASPIFVLIPGKA